MKIELKNFGPIHHFTFDLDKDLHVIYGENNVGKSYAIGAVYLILKNLRRITLPFSPFGMVSADAINSIIDYIKISINKGEKKITITDHISSLIRQSFEGYFLAVLQASFENSFSNLSDISNKFNEAKKPEISILLKTLAMRFTVQENQLMLIEFTYQNPIIAVSIIDYDHVKNYNELISFSETTLENGLFKEELHSKLLSLIGTALSEIWKQISHIHFFPASRTGLYESFSGIAPILAKLSQVRSTIINDSLTLPNFSETVSDYFINLSTIKSPKSDNAYSKIVHLIEKDLINAEIIYNSEKGKLEYFSKSLNLRLNLSETSSMISEIAPIVALFKYSLTSDDQEYLNYRHFSNYETGVQRSPLLFIEEPEAHLHPKLQVKMMEICAAMVKCGIKVVMTTHSDFMLSKLTNLLLSDTIPASKVASYHIVMGKNGSYDAENMKANEEGIEDYNFIDVTEQLYEERINLLEKQNSNASK